MWYMGSKRLIAKHILPIILNDRKGGQWYVEPFVGGANSFQCVPNPKLGGDCNRHVIQALLVIRDNRAALPKKADDISPEFYQELKSNTGHMLHGYVGYACSFGGKYYGGRVKSSYPKDKYLRDRVAAQYEAAKTTREGIRGCVLLARSYDELFLPDNSIIYCDPPYEGTTGYSNKDRFDHAKFWQWCRDKTLEGHTVFISEYNAPDDFECVWQKEINNNLSTKTLRPTEKLFIYKI